MNRWLAALIAASLVVTGCGARERTSPSSIPPVTAPPSAAASPVASPVVPVTAVICPSNPPPILPPSFAEGVPFTLCQELARVAFIPEAAPLRVSLELVQRGGRLYDQLQIWKRTAAGLEYPDVTHSWPYELTSAQMRPAFELRWVKTFRPAGSVSEHFGYTLVDVNMPRGFECCTALSRVVAWDGCNVAEVMEGELIEPTAGGGLIVWTRALGASRIQEGEVAREYRWTGTKYVFFSGPTPQPRPTLPSYSCRP